MPGGIAERLGRCNFKGGPMSESSDRAILDLIRREGPLTVAALAGRLGVTATAVRNRLTRLVEAGLVERQAEAGGRGRPRHAYRASADGPPARSELRRAGRRRSGTS